VLYYGNEWDGGCELYDLLDFSDIPEELKPLVNNYKIHLIDIKKIQDTSVFKTDVRQVFDFIRYSEDSRKMKELLEKDEAYQNLDEDAYDMVALYTKSKELLKLAKQHKEGDNIDMCKAIQDMMQEERTEGRAEGRAEGKAYGIRAFILDNIEEKVSAERICEKLQRRFQMSKAEAEEIYQRISEEALH